MRYNGKIKYPCIGDTINGKYTLISTDYKDGYREFKQGELITDGYYKGVFVVLGTVEKHLTDDRTINFILAQRVYSAKMKPSKGAPIVMSGAGLEPALDYMKQVKHELNTTLEVIKDYGI